MYGYPHLNATRTHLPSPYRFERHDFDVEHDTGYDAGLDAERRQVERRLRTVVLAVAAASALVLALVIAVAASFTDGTSPSAEPGVVSSIHCPYLPHHKWSGCMPVYERRA